MSFAKAFSKRVKWIECKGGVGGKHSPVPYIPEQDPVQDALEKNKKNTYVKLTLPNTGNELKVAVWVFGTPEQFVLHIGSVIHACKQMGLDANFTNTEKAVLNAKLKAKLAKMEYPQVCSSKKKRIRAIRWKAISPKAISRKALTPNRKP